LVWWIGKRMVAERELGCDEEVLSSGGEARVYAEAILNVCKLFVESPLSCVSGVTGADLKKRIEEIMANRTSLGLSVGKKMLLVGAGALALTVAVVIGLVDAARVQAQSQKLTFEVASVRPHVGMDRMTLTAPTVLPSGRFVFRFPLPFLIAYAYRLPFNRNARLTGMPDWAPQAIYDVEATSTMPAGLSIQARGERVRLMVQALLADRFKLAIHREPKEMPVFALVVAKWGPKLQPADIDEKDCPEAQLEPPPPLGSTPVPGVCHAFNGGQGRGLHARAVDMSDLTSFVENWTDRPLLDKTGITGLYRIETKGWLPLDAAPSTAAGPGTDHPTLYEVFEQLGLKMEPRKGVTDVYVIDHIEKPSEN
jgi:bla regulator protein BlaR1